MFINVYFKSEITSRAACCGMLFSDTLELSKTQHSTPRACCGMLLLADSADLSKLDILRRWHVDQC